MLGLRGAEGTKRCRSEGLRTVGGDERRGAKEKSSAGGHFVTRFLSESFVRCASGSQNIFRTLSNACQYVELLPPGLVVNKLERMASRAERFVQLW